MTAGTQGDAIPPVIDNAQAASRVILVCEHASRVIPTAWGTLGLTAEQQAAHIAWDPGALAVAQGLSSRLDAVLVHAQASRLVYDLNRAPDQRGAMAIRSEDQDIPGNRGLTAADRMLRTAALYLPFHDTLHGVIAARIAAGRAPVVVTIHSFTPVWFGTPRAVEFGVIHDEDPTLARAILDRAGATGMDCRLNEPYSAADDVTHTLRLHATPYRLPNAMLEIRNDLIATPAACAAMAETLAPVIAGAVASLPMKESVL